MEGEIRSLSDMLSTNLSERSARKSVWIVSSGNMTRQYDSTPLRTSPAYISDEERTGEYSGFFPRYIEFGLWLLASLGPVLEMQIRSPGCRDVLYQEDSQIR